jgi:cell division protein FtsZ
MVTKPFGFEGTHRNQVAEEGIGNLIDKVDTLIIIPNDRLLSLCDHKTSVDNAFRMADEVLCRAVQAIAGVVTVPGLINLDFADIRAVMKDAGPAWISIGRGSGKNRASDAAKDALSSPLLDVSVNRAKGVLINFAGSSDLTLFEINDAAKAIKQAVDPEANVIFGVVVDPTISDEVRLTLIITGLGVRTAPSDVPRDKEATRLLKGLKDEAELDVPSFLRQRRGLPGQRSHPPSPRRN